MATSGKPNSPARIGTRSGRLKRSGPDPIKIPELSETLDVADNSLPVENAYEKQRRLRIESNHARMAVMSCFCRMCSHPMLISALSYTLRVPTALYHIRGHLPLLTTVHHA